MEPTGASSRLFEKHPPNVHTKPKQSSSIILGDSNASRGVLHGGSVGKRVISGVKSPVVQLPAGTSPRETLKARPDFPVITA